MDRRETPHDPTNRRRASTGWRRLSRASRRYARGVLELQQDDVVLPVPKLFFGYARDMAALFPFGVGAAGIVFGQRTTPQLVFELIERHRPTILVQVPTMMRAMLDLPGAADHDLSCLRLCTSAGEALPRELYDEWRATFGVEVLDGIGSSEAYHIFISNRLGAVDPAPPGEVVPGYRGPGRRRGWTRASGRRGRAAVDRGAHGGADVLEGPGVRRDVRRRAGDERRPVRPRRRRLLHLRGAPTT